MSTANREVSVRQSCQVSIYVHARAPSWSIPATLLLGGYIAVHVGATHGAIVTPGKPRAQAVDVETMRTTKVVHHTVRMEIF